MREHRVKPAKNAENITMSLKRNIQKP